MTNKTSGGSRNARPYSHRLDPSRDRAHRRLCLDAGGQLARGDARSVGTCRRHPCASGGGKRAYRGRACRSHGSARGAVRGNARPHQGGRFLGADAGRSVGLWHALRLRCRTATRRARAGRRHRRRGTRYCSTARRWRKVTPISASAVSGTAPIIAFSPTPRTRKGRSISTSAFGMWPRAKDLADLVPATTGGLVWSPDGRPPSTTCAWTTITGRRRSGGMCSARIPKATR